MQISEEELLNEKSNLFRNLKVRVLKNIIRKITNFRISS